MRPGWRKRECRIAWLEACSFSMIAHGGARVDFGLSPLSSQRVAFVLDSPTATLAWDIARGDNEEAVQRSDQLAAMIVARAHLPLRDLTAAAAKVTTQPWRKQFAEVRSVFIGEGQISAVWPEMPHFLTSRKIALILLGAALIPLVLFSSIYMMAYGLQRYQTQYYSDLLAQVRSHTPLYHDALNLPNSDWPLHTPTATDPGGYRFVSGAYQLSGETTQGYTFAVTSNPSGAMDGDMAVEVTARQYGGPDYLGVGLTLHANGSDEGAVVFTVSPSGEWMLHTPAQTRSSLFSFQGKQYVHGQAGAPNRLTLIERQGEYICYINGQFVGIERDASLHHGYAGVAMLGTPSMTGVFTDFTVYPV
jgi:hypothetical protein